MRNRDRELVLLILLALVLALLALCWRDHGVEHDVHVGTRPAGPSLDLGLVEALAASTSTTTAPPTTSTTAPPKVSHPARTIRAASVEPGPIPDMIRAGFARFGSAVAEQAVRVSGCETGHTYDPHATNGAHAGLFQLSRTYHEERARKLGYSWDRMFEAGPNIAVAADLYAESGWGPWTCRYAA